MSKIVQAINAMIINKDKVSDVIKGRDDEVFFRYDNKYKWSISKGADGEYLLWYYPVDVELKYLAGFEPEDWDGVPMVAYKTAEIGTKEARASFAELYSILKERMYGMNEVLDDIIGEFE